MSQLYYPTVTQLQARLFSIGILDAPPTSEQDQLDLQSATTSASETWEDIVGYQPFLADTVDSTWYFDADGSTTVDLQGGFVSITSVSLNGNLRTLNTDYRTYPQNAAASGKPITYLKFQGYFRPFPALYGQKESVVVIGKRGAYATLPPLAYECVLAIAMKNLLAWSEFANFGGVKSWKSGTTEEEYDPDAFMRIAAGCDSIIASGLQAYSRKKFA